MYVRSNSSCSRSNIITEIYNIPTLYIRIYMVDIEERDVMLFVVLELFVLNKI